jgi:hypothetical protein
MTKITDDKKAALGAFKRLKEARIKNWKYQDMATDENIVEAALTAPSAPEWQTIESAPRDGTLFLATDGKTVFITRPRLDNLGNATCTFVMPHANLIQSKKPTHWLPLPAAPVAANGGEVG